MPIKPTNIPSRESQRVEFKAFTGGFSDREIARTLCAFANTDGGDLYVGMADSGEAVGLSVTPTLLDRVQNAAREGCSPPINIRLTTIKTSSKKAVLKISTGRSDNLHSTADGQTFVRIGTQDKRVLGDELLRLAETKSHKSFEDSLLDCGLEVIDMQALEEYAQARLKSSLSASKLDAEDLLIKIGLAEKKGKTFKIRAGAFLLFGKAESQLLLQRDMVFVVYDMAQSMYRYRENISLPITKSVSRIVELLRPLNMKTEVISGLKRESNLVYPEGAIREALLNSIAHRDYRIQGLRNEIRVYPDKLEFISAGGLPGMITLENMERQHYSRNPKIMHALLTLGYVEELGQGIDLIKSQLKANGNPEPIFEAFHDLFKVTFLQRAGSVSKESKHKRILEALTQSSSLSRQQLEAHTGLGSTTLKNTLSQLLETRRISRVGKGRATKYRLGEAL